VVLTFVAGSAVNPSRVNESVLSGSLLPQPAGPEQLCSAASVNELQTTGNGRRSVFCYNQLALL
jgi:hypothetical protein